YHAERDYVGGPELGQREPDEIAPTRHEEYLRPPRRGQLAGRVALPRGGPHRRVLLAGDGDRAARPGVIEAERRVEFLLQDDRQGPHLLGEGRRALREGGLRGLRRLHDAGDGRTHESSASGDGWLLFFAGPGAATDEATEPR